MLKIHCLACGKSFLWTDNMPAQGKCPNADCEGNYNIHSALKQNVASKTTAAEKKILLCPSCGGEVFAAFTICRHCNHIVFGAWSFRKTSFFVTVCIFLIGLSLILKYLVK